MEASSPSPPTMRAAAGFAVVGEDLTDALVVVIDGDVQIAAADLDPFGGAVGHIGTRARVIFAHGGLLRGVALVLDLADVEHLLVAAAVPVDGHALAVELEGQPVHLSDLLAGGVVVEADRLGDGVVGIFLEGGLHADVEPGVTSWALTKTRRMSCGISSMWAMVPRRRRASSARLNRVRALRAPGAGWGWTSSISVPSIMLRMYIAENRPPRLKSSPPAETGFPWGDGGDGAVALRLFLGQNAFKEEGEGAAGFGQTALSSRPVSVMKRHDQLGEFDGLIRIGRIPIRSRASAQPMTPRGRSLRACLVT